MPKVVDHAVRRREIGRAVAHLIAAEGLETLTVRKAATASGWSTGVLAHYVKDKDELISLAMEAITDDVIERFVALPDTTPLERIRNAMRELLPLTDRAALELNAWLQFVLYANRSGQHPRLSGDHRMLRDSMARGIAEAQTEGEIAPELDARATAAELLALVDGLALHHLLDPDLINRKALAAALDRYLASLGRGA